MLKTDNLYWLISAFLMVPLIFPPMFLVQEAKTKTGDFLDKEEKLDILVSQDVLVSQNTIILPLNSYPNYDNPDYDNPDIFRKIKVIVTAYSSSPMETQGNPFITASGARVRDGIVANNMLAFGTKIRLPGIFGDKIFVVKDRMHRRKNYNHIDVWFPSRSEALQFGAKITEMEILVN